MSFSENDHVVEALSAHAAERALADGVGFRCTHRCSQDLDARPVRHGVEPAAELVVVVADEEPRSLAPRGGFPELLGDPSTRGHPRHGDAHDPPRAEFDEEEGDEGTEEEVVGLQEVAGADLVRVVAKGRSPRMAPRVEVRASGRAPDGHRAVLRTFGQRRRQRRRPRHPFFDICTGALMSVGTADLSSKKVGDPLAEPDRGSQVGRERRAVRSERHDDGTHGARVVGRAALRFFCFALGLTQPAWPKAAGPAPSYANLGRQIIIQLATELPSLHQGLQRLESR